MGEIRKFVISLEDSDRIESFRRQPFGEYFEVFTAFDGRKNPIPEFVDEEAFAEVLGRKPLPGEIGCAVSHYEVYKKFVAENKERDLLIIAEDDARFYTHVEKILQRIIKVTNWEKVGIVILSSAGEEAGVRDVHSPSQKLAALSIFSTIVGWAKKYPFMLGDISGHASGAGFYIITYRAAQTYVQLIEGGHKISCPSDFYHVWARNTRLKIVRPGLASWEGVSTIGGDDHTWNKSSFSSNNLIDLIKRKVAIQIRVKMIPLIFKASFRRR